MENQVRDILKQAKDLKTGPSPFLATRVLAELKERRLNRRLRFWKIFGVVSPAMSLALLLLVWAQLDSQVTMYDAKVGSPYVVRIEMAELDPRKIAQAEIILPEGVHFFSEKYPEIREKRQLSLQWNGQFEQAHFPFVITGKRDGTKKVKVRFYGEDRKLIMEKDLNIRFRQAQNSNDSQTMEVGS